MGVNTGNRLSVKKRINISDTFEPKYQFVEKKIFPEYYFITVERYPNIVKRRVDEWIYMIKNAEIADGSSSKNIDKATQKLAEINMSQEERKQYERYLINLVRDKDVVNTAKEEGLEKGLKKGREEGKLKGRIEGKKEEITSLEHLCETGVLTLDQLQLCIKPKQKELKALHTQLE